MDTSPRNKNDNQTRQFVNQKARTVIGIWETIANRVVYKRQEARGVPLSTEQDEWLQDTDEEPDEKPDEQELEAHYMYMEKIQEVLQATDDNSGPTYDVDPLEKVQIDDEYNAFTNEHEHTDQPENMNDISLMEKVDRNTTLDSSDMCNNEFEDDQNADDHEDECVVLANLIANLKLDIDENKKIQKASFVNPKYLKKAQSEKPCLYKVPYDKYDLVNIFALNYDETLLLEEECRSKLDKEKIKKKDILCVSYMFILDSDNYCDMACKYLDKIQECERLEFELSKQNKFLKNKPTNLSNHSLESENICLKKIVAQLQKDFSKMESHCVALELKYENQALKLDQHGRVLKDIDDIETINIELEHMGWVFWGADEEVSDGGSPRVIVLGYDGLPIHPVAPPSPDYIPGPEEPQTPPVP
ncbi:hypothetical protein Tco_1386990 [Tanacetum coccineum]